MEDLAVIQRAIDSLTHRIRRMTYKLGGTSAEKDSFHANRVLLAFWTDRMSKLSEEEEWEVSKQADELIKRTRLDSQNWREYQVEHSNQIIAFSARPGNQLEVAMATTADKTWREFAEEQIELIKQDLRNRDRFVKRAIDEGSQDPTILMHLVERLEIREITGQVTKEDIKQLQTFDARVPDWRDRLEAVYYSGYNPNVVFGQFLSLFGDYLKPDDPYEGITHEYE